MKRRNNIRRWASSLLYVGLFAVVASCGNDDVEIVSQDTEWTIGSKYIEEDIRVQLDMDPYTKLVYFGYGLSPMNEINGTYNTVDVVIEGKDKISIKVKLTSVCTEDVSVSLVKNEANLDKCPVDVSGYQLMPEANYAIAPQVIRAGEQETIFKVELKNTEALTLSPGYILPLIIQLEESYEGLKLAQIRSCVFVKLNMSLIFENIDSSNLPIEGTVFNAGVIYSSNVSSGTVDSFNDGSLSNEWYTSSTTAYIEMVLPEKVLLKGLKVDTTTKYELKKARVFIDKGDGVWIDNYYYNREAPSPVAYIKLKQPLECKRIRLENISSFATYVDINEISFIK